VRDGSHAVPRPVSAVPESAPNGSGRESRRGCSSLLSFLACLRECGTSFVGGPPLPEGLFRRGRHVASVGPAGERTGQIGDSPLLAGEDTAESGGLLRGRP